MEKISQIGRGEVVDGLEPGGLMWVDLPALARQKLSPKWSGLFRVLRRLNSITNDIGVDYELLNQREHRAKPKIIHYNRLKPYCSAWSAGGTPPSPTGQAVPVNTSSPPLLTALSGSRPYVYRHPATHTCPVTPSQTNVSSLPPRPATAGRGQCGNRMS